jgi:hypothetical protein
MSVIRYESPRLQNIKIASLQAQHDFLRVLRLRHLQWSNATDDLEIKGAHLAVVALLERMADQYSALLDSLSQPGQKDQQ